MEIEGNVSSLQKQKEADGACLTSVRKKVRMICWMIYLRITSCRMGENDDEKDKRIDVHGHDDDHKKERTAKVLDGKSKKHDSFDIVL